jgi:hypothetical protein
VYSPGVAPLRLADGTPLYLEWIIEDEDGTLYRVPAEQGGWLGRRPYEGQAHSLRPVTSREAAIILRLTCAAEAASLDAPVTAGHSFEHHY